MEWIELGGFFETFDGLDGVPRLTYYFTGAEEQVKAFGIFDYSFLQRAQRYFGRGGSASELGDTCTNLCAVKSRCI